MVTTKKAVIRKSPVLPVYFIAGAIIALMIAANVTSVKTAAMPQQVNFVDGF